MKPYIQSSLPNYHVREKQTKSDVYSLLLPKPQKIIDRGYVKIGHGHEFLKSYIDYFFVPKADDVRPVYNGTSCGFNESIWAPDFWLPTAKSATRVLYYNYCGVGIADLGEMLLNFPLPQVFVNFRASIWVSSRLILAAPSSPLQGISSRYDRNDSGWDSDRVLTMPSTFITGRRKSFVVIGDHLETPCDGIVLYSISPVRENLTRCYPGLPSGMIYGMA
jgi:hypothetical protein